MFRENDNALALVVFKNRLPSSIILETTANAEVENVQPQLKLVFNKFNDLVYDSVFRLGIYRQ
jgi:hypothetical protein